MLPQVHGVFLARMLRHMLENPGMICDRDYERLSFVYGILLSDKCQVGGRGLVGKMVGLFVCLFVCFRVRVCWRAALLFSCSRGTHPPQAGVMCYVATLIELSPDETD